ncbi:MAG: pilus assembly protein PilM [Chloroflexota bacterium]|nr:pilus assembly protein PilM [Chloroflexota bacterium]
MRFNPFRKPEETVTLNIECDSIRLLVVKGKEVQKWGNLELEPGLVEEGLIVNPAAVGLGIKSLLTSQGASGKGVVISLTGLRAIPRFLDLPDMPQHQLEEAIKREAKREMPLSLDDLYLSWQVTSKVGDKQHIYLLGVPRNMVDAHIRALQAAGARPLAMDIKPLSLTRAVNKEKAIIADLEADTLDVIVVVDCIPAIMRSFALRRELSPSEKVDRLADELMRTVDFYNNSRTESPLGSTTTVYVMGALMGERPLRNSLAKRIDRPIEVPEPPLEWPAHFPIAQYMVNIGLALKEVR